MGHFIGIIFPCSLLAVSMITIEASALVDAWRRFSSTEAGRWPFQQPTELIQTVDSYMNPCAIPSIHTILGI